MTNTISVPRELLEQIDECAICDGTDATIDGELFNRLVGLLAAPAAEVEGMEVIGFHCMDSAGIETLEWHGWSYADEPLCSLPKAQAVIDQLKADSEVMADLVESRLAENLRIKAENERLKKEVRSWVIRIQQRGLEMDELSDERDALRTKLDEARELLNGIERGCLLSDDDAKIDAWLEANP